MSGCSRPWLGRRAQLAVQGQIQSEDVDRGLTEEAEGPPLRLTIHEGLDLGDRPSAGLGHPRHLPPRAFRAQVRIEAAPRGGDELRRNRSRRVRVLLLEPLDVRLDAVAELPGRGPE